MRGPSETSARLRPAGYAGHHASLFGHHVAAPREARRAKRGGARRDRTADLLHAMQALSQLSYGPLTSRYALGGAPAKRAQNIVRDLSQVSSSSPTSPMMSVTSSSPSSSSAMKVESSSSSSMVSSTSMSSSDSGTTAFTLPEFSSASASSSGTSSATGSGTTSAVAAAAARLSARVRAGATGAIGTTSPV